MLGKGVLYGVRPKQQPVGYVATLTYPACLRYVTACPSAFMGRVRLPKEALGIIFGAIVLAVLWVLACCVVFWCAEWLGSWSS